MGPERRKQILLGGLVVVLLVAAGLWWSQSASPSPSSKRTPGTSTAARRAGGTAADAPEVRLKALEALGSARSAPPGGEQRNLFRFKPPPPPPAPDAAARAAAPPPSAVPAGPPVAPPPPPIPLKFLGVVETQGKSQRLAVLSDGRGGPPFSGKEGDIIEGRYRILQIGSESIVMVYVDGRGRQVIRQSGS